MKADIKQAVSDWNPWLSGNFPIELLGFERNCYHLIDYLKIPEIKIIEGARRVGKSTLMYQVIYHLFKSAKKVLYINFEDEILKKYSLADIVYTCLEDDSYDYLFVDEIQNCTEWVTFVRKVYDRRELKQVWVSGSNSSLIKQEYATLLTGRNLALHIYSLSFTEFLGFKKIGKEFSSRKSQTLIKSLFTEYMEFGAFPAVVTRDVFKKELLLAYFDDFIYKDIVSRFNVNAMKIKELALYLATNSGKIFSYRSLAKALNSHPNTIIDYFDYFKSAFLFEELYKFDYSLKKQFSNDKKIYCIDTGLASAVSFRFSEDKGRILENIVFSELRRRGLEIYFHKQKLECDFVVKQELQITQAIQVCLSLEDAKTKAREINGLLEAMKIYDLEKGCILTLDEEGEEVISVESREYHIEIQSVWKWMLLS